MPDPFYIIYDNEDQAYIRSEQVGTMRGLRVKVENKEDPRAALVLPTKLEQEVNEDTGEIVKTRIVPIDFDLLNSDDFIQMVPRLPNDWVYPLQAPEEIIQPD